MHVDGFGKFVQIIFRNLKLDMVGYKNYTIEFDISVD